MVTLISNWIIFLGSCVVGVFITTDEEPFIDFTDWNIVHVIIFLFCVKVIVWDSLLRSKYGQWIYKDQVLILSTFNFWYQIENYCRIIIIGFCIHCLTPLESELVDLVDVFQNILVWYTSDILPTTLCISIIMLLIYLVNFFINWQYRRLLVLTSSFIVFLISINLLIIIWDFISSSLSNYIFQNNPKQLYIQNRTNISYNMLFQVEDMYDWHISQPQTFVFRFEDLYFFYLQLFNIVSLYSCCFIWILFLHNILNNKLSIPYTSNLFLGICIRWTDHTFWCFLYSHIIVIFTSIRIYLRLTLELGIWLV